MDYYCCGLVGFSSAVDECKKLFDDDSMFFIEDNTITSQIDQICNTTNQKLKDMAKNGLESLVKNRDYEKMAKKLKEFINDC
nr:hypothetical protein [Campylobacter sp. RM16192]